MNIRLLNNRLKDSSKDVSEEIKLVSSKLEALGVEFDSQSIGEPDTAYLTYLNDMLPVVPVVEDSTENTANKMQASTLSALIPQLDFYVEIDGGYIDGLDVEVKAEEDEFTSTEITAGEFLVRLFGLGADLHMQGYVTEGMRSYDYDQPDDPDEITISYSDLTLQTIAGVYVSKKDGTPVVYLIGSDDIEDMHNFKGFADIKSEVESAPKETLPQFGEFSSVVASALDSVLEKYIGSQIYKTYSAL